MTIIIDGKRIANDLLDHLAKKSNLRKLKYACK